jgi:hypothetical protein
LSTEKKRGGEEGARIGGSLFLVFWPGAELWRTLCDELSGAYHRGRASWVSRGLALWLTSIFKENCVVSTHKNVYTHFYVATKTLKIAYFLGLSGIYLTEGENMNIF